jgi:hypothetical protein
MIRPPFPPAHHNAPPRSSDLAAEAIAPRSESLRGRVLAFLESRGSEGATDEHGEHALGLKPQTYTPRRGELVKLGLVVRSELRRPTSSGCSAVVWFAASHAPAAVEVRP